MNTQLIEAIPHIPEADTFDLRKSWEYFRQAMSGHLLLILLTSMCTVGAVMLYIIIWPTVYQAEVQILAEGDDDRMREEFYSHWNVFRRNNLADEIHLINSRAVLENTVDALGLTYDDVYHPFLSYTAYLWGESLVGKTYRKFKYMIFTRYCEPNCPTEEEKARARTLIDFKSGVALMPAPDSFVGNVVVRGSSPRVAEIANTLVEVYLEERKLRYVEEAEKSYASLKKESDKVKIELLEAEQAVAAYYEENNILLEFEKDKVEIAKWLELKSAVTESESLRALTAESLAEVERQIENEHKAVVGSTTYSQNSRKVILRDQLTQLKMALNQTQIRYMPGSPEVTDIKKQITGITQMIEDEEDMEQYQFSEVLSTTYESLRQTRGTLKSQLAGMDARLGVQKVAEAKLGANVAEIPGKVSIARAMGRDVLMLEQKFIGLQGKLTTAAVSKATVASAPSSISVVDWAIPPLKPSWPNKKLLVLLALVMGAFSGAMLGMFLDLINKRVNRYNLSHEGSSDGLYALLRRDSDYLNSIFLVPPPPKPRLLTKLTR